MNQIDHNEEESHSVKKLLNALPKVHVSDDFEQRLQRKLTQEESQTAADGKFAISRLVPTFAYSLMALLAVGVVSYYVFMKTGANSPATTPVTESHSPAESGKSEAAGKRQEQILRNEPAASNDAPQNVVITKPGRLVEPKSESIAKKIERKDQDQKETNVDESNQIKSAQSEAAGAADKANPVQEETTIQQAPSVKPSANSTVPAFAVPSVQSQGVMPMQKLSVTDSLRKDSLQKAQQQILQQKAKSKKPL